MISKTTEIMLGNCRIIRVGFSVSLPRPGKFEARLSRHTIVCLRLLGERTIIVLPFYSVCFGKYRTLH